MPHHRHHAVCCFTSLLLFFMSSAAEASRWHSSFPAQQLDRIDPINLLLIPDESRLEATPLSDQFLSAIAAMDSPLTSSTTSAETHVLYRQLQQKTLSSVQTQYLHSDLLGSVVLETDSDGNVIKTNTYKPFGESGNH